MPEVNAIGERRFIGEKKSENSLIVTFMSLQILGKY